MITDCALYRGGVREPGTDEPAVAWRRRQESEGDSYLWIDLFEPTQQELEGISRVCQVHDLAVEELVSSHQRPKLEVYDLNLLVVLTPAVYDDVEESITLRELKVLTGPGYIFTVRHYQTDEMLAVVRQRLERTPALVAHGPFAALHAIVDRVVDDYGPVLDEVEADIEDVETQVFSDTRDQPTQRIHHLTRQVVAFQHGTLPLVEPLDLLARHHFMRVPDDLTEYFRDVHDHLRRVTERIIGDRELLASVLGANLAEISTRQNEDMRKISAWVGILAVPTAVAGIYGMNFQHMPELTWTFGYPFALGLMVLFCIILFVVFKRSGWI